jgi:hypothetical protein
MTIAVKAIYENGCLQAEGAAAATGAYRGRGAHPDARAVGRRSDRLAAAQALIRFIDDAPAEMAEHHDHYLYSRPRE